MKKLLIFLFILISVNSFGQLIQFPNAKGFGWPYVGGDSGVWIPSDTLRPTSQIIGRTLLGRKGTTIYYWNGTKYVAISSGSGGFINSIGTGFPIGITGTNDTRKIGFKFGATGDSTTTANTLTVGADTSSSGLSSYYLRLKDSVSTSFPTGFVKGKAPVGIIINQAFTGGTLPSGWSQQNGAATWSFGGGNGLSASGGSGSLTDNFVKTQFVSMSNNYYYTIPFTIVTKPTSYTQGLAFTKFGIQPMYVVARYGGFSDSMKLVLNINGSFVDSTNNIAMANGNNYSVTINVSNNTVYYGISLLSGTSLVSLKDHVYSIPIGYSTIAMPCIGSPGFVVLGGSYNKITFQQYDNDLYGSDVMIVGTSISQGYYLASFENNWVSKSFEGSGKTYVNFGSSQGTLADVINALPEIYLHGTPIVGVEMGINDICNSSLRIRMNSVIDSLQAHGKEVFWISDFIPNACKDTVIINVCNEQGIVYLNPYANLTAASLPDAVHPNDLGAINIAKYNKSKAPQYFGKVGAIEQYSLQGLRDVSFSGLANSDIMLFNSTTKQWNNGTSPGLFILNQYGTNQTGNFQITGYGRINSGLGVGGDVTSSYKLQTFEANADYYGLLMTNTSATSPTSSKTLNIGVAGGTGFSIADWPNAGIMESQVTGGLVYSAYAGTHKWQVGNLRTTAMTLNSTGLGLGVASASITHALTVNGQIKVFAPQAGDVDSLATWKDGVLSATPTSSISVTNAMLAGSIAASKLVGSDIATTGTITSGTWNGTIITSAFGGTGNGFTKFTGPATSEKTFTLPNATATILTTNAAVTIAQGGTGQATAAAARVALLPSLTGNTLKLLRVNAGETDVEWVTAGAGSGTVTNTGGNLTSNSVVLGAGTVDTKVVAGLTTDGTSVYIAGVNTTTAGKVKLFGGTSGDATIQTAAAAGTATVVTLPNASSTLPIFGQQITFSGPTAARTVTLPDANFTAARTDAANTFTGTQTFSSTISGSINGNAATVTTNANLTGDVTSVGNATTIAAPSETAVDNNTGGWVTKKVSGSDVTTTGSSLVDITGLISGTLSASATYEVDGMLIVTTSAVTTGTEYGLNCTGTGADQSINWIGPSTEGSGVQVLNEVGTGNNNVAGTPAFLTTASMAGCVWFHGYVTTGTGSPTMAIRHLKVTSGTSTVKIGSTFRYRKL